MKMALKTWEYNTLSSEKYYDDFDMLSRSQHAVNHVFLIPYDVFKERPGNLVKRKRNGTDSNTNTFVIVEIIP